MHLQGDIDTAQAFGLQPQLEFPLALVYLGTKTLAQGLPDPIRQLLVLRAALLCQRILSIGIGNGPCPEAEGHRSGSFT